MRKKVVSFPDEARQRFQFLVDDGFHGPECSDFLLPSITYKSAELKIAAHLNNDPHDGAGGRISVMIRLDSVEGVARADLDEVVEAAIFAPRHRVATRGHSGDAIRATLDDNATWIRRLLPLLRGSGAFEMIRRATRPALDRNGNPKPRPKNIKWKYA